jgi:hypothetical protein
VLLSVASVGSRSSSYWMTAIDAEGLAVVGLRTSWVDA